ncbi:unnamed protein product, partial [Rotaria sp. Silwood1]
MLVVIVPTTPSGKICANLKIISQCTSAGDVPEYV